MELRFKKRQHLQKTNADVTVGVKIDTSVHSIAPFWRPIINVADINFLTIIYESNVLMKHINCFDELRFLMKIYRYKVISIDLIFSFVIVRKYKIVLILGTPWHFGRNYEYFLCTIYCADSWQKL